MSMIYLKLLMLVSTNCIVLSIHIINNMVHVDLTKYLLYLIGRIVSFILIVNLTMFMM